MGLAGTLRERQPGGQALWAGRTRASPTASQRQRRRQLGKSPPKLGSEATMNASFRPARPSWMWSSRSPDHELVCAEPNAASALLHEVNDPTGRHDGMGPEGCTPPGGGSDHPTGRRSPAMRVAEMAGLESSRRLVALSLRGMCFEGDRRGWATRRGIHEEVR